MPAVPFGTTARATPMPAGTSAATPLTSEGQALKEEQERMNALLASLQVTLGKTPSTQQPTTTSPTVRSMAMAPPTPAAAALEAASSVAAEFSPLRTVDRPTTTPFTKNTPQLSSRPAAMAGESIASHSLIEMTGDLQEARGALEAERVVTQRLTRQLAELTTKMSQVAHERTAEKSESRRAADALRAAEEEAAAARAARDDALRRLAAAQQSIAASRQAADYAAAEASAQSDAKLVAAQQEAARAVSEAAEARQEAMGKEAEVGALRFEARQSNEEVVRLRAMLSDAESHARRVSQPQARAADAAAHFLTTAGSTGSGSGGASLEMISHTLSDLEAFTRALSRDGGEAVAFSAAPGAAEAMSGLAKRALEEAQRKTQQQASQIGALDAECATLRAALARTGGGAGGAAAPTSAAAAQALVRASELEATVADLQAQLQQARGSGGSRGGGRMSSSAASPPINTFDPSAMVRARATALEVSDASARTAEAEAKAVRAAEALREEATRHASTRRELEELRHVTASSKGSVVAAQEEAGEVRAQQELWRRRLEEAERRVNEHASRADALEEERRAWREEMTADKARLRELDGQAARHAKEMVRLQAMVEDTRQNAERRAAEAIAVRELSRDHRVAQAAKPSVELLRENERLRKLVDDLSREGDRRAQETVAAMAARTEELRSSGGGSDWGDGISRMFRM